MEKNCSNYANNASRVIILVSRYRFLAMTDPMKPYTLRFNMQVTCKSKMATKTLDKMAVNTIEYCSISSVRCGSRLSHNVIIIILNF